MPNYEITLYGQTFKCPPNANWIVIDEDLSVWFYEEHPEKGLIFSGWFGVRSPFIPSQHYQKLNNPPANFDWTTELYQII